MSNENNNIETGTEAIAFCPSKHRNADYKSKLSLYLSCGKIFGDDFAVTDLDTITIGHDIFHPEQISTGLIQDLVEIITDEKNRETFEFLRSRKTEEEQKQLKMGLKYYLLGKFDGKRANDRMIYMTGMTLDYDDVTDPFHVIQRVIPQQNAIWAAFISPRGNGLKVIIRFDTPIPKSDTFRAIYKWVQKQIDSALGLSSDATSDPARATFVSFDSNMYVNPENPMLSVEKLLKQVEMEAENLQDKSRSTGGGLQDKSRSTFSQAESYRASGDLWGDAFSAVTHLCTVSIPHDDWVKAGMAIYSGFGQEGKQLWDMFGHNPNYHDSQKFLDAKWQSFANVARISVNSLFWVAGKHGWINQYQTQPEIPEAIQIGGEITSVLAGSASCSTGLVTQDGILLDDGIANPVIADPNKNTFSAESTSVSAGSASCSTFPDPDGEITSVLAGSVSCSTLPVGVADQGKELDKQIVTGLLDFQNMMTIFGKVDNVPLDIERLPKFIQEYLAIAEQITDAQPGALMTALLPVIAVNIGDKVFMNNNGGRISCNTWSVIIGPSTISRKTTALKLAKSTMNRYMDTLEGVDNKEFRKITPVLTNVTHACLMNLLSKNPRRLIISNEFSAFLASIGASWNQGMKQSITDLFDGETQSNMNMERTERIKNPNLSLLAASTEGWFYHQLSTNSEQLSGFMQRSLYYIISDVDVSKLNFDHVDTSEAWESLAMYDDVYQVFRSLPMSYRLKAEPEAMEYRNQCYKTILIQINKLNVDSIMSYCSRIYDGYLYKFATMITLFKHVGELAEAVANNEVSRFFQEVKVTMETIKEAIYMCDFYFQNTIPLLKLMSEQDKLAIETKLVNSLCRKHNGKASHSDLMRDVRIPKKVMKDAIETLIEMDIISVTTTHAKNGKTAKGYLLDPEIMASMLR